MRWRTIAGWTLIAIAFLVLEFARELTLLDKEPYGASKRIYFDETEPLPTYVSAKGVWKVTNNEQLDRHTLEIVCDIPRSACRETTVYYFNGMLDVLSIDLPIKSNSKETIVYVNEMPICENHKTTIDLSQNRIIRVKQSKPKPSDSAKVIDCPYGKEQIEMELSDGWEVDLMLDKAAMTKGFNPILRLLYGFD